jgi:hypothetical protein
MFAGRQVRDIEALSDPAGCLAGSFQSKDRNNEVNRTKRARAASEAFHCVVGFPDADRCGSIAVVMKFRAPTVNVAVIADSEIECTGDFNDGDLSIDEP